MDDFENLEDKELVITPRELQPLYDCLVRLTIAVERIADSSEQQTAFSKEAYEHTKSMTDGLMLDSGAFLKSAMGMLGEEEPNE